MAQNERMPIQHAPKSLPLTPEEQASYAVTVEQIEAIFALENMAPSAHDKAITAAVLSGQISLDDALVGVLAHLQKHKTLEGYLPVVVPPNES